MSADGRRRPDLERLYRMRSSSTSGSGGGSTGKRGCLVIPLALLTLLSVLGAVLERGVPS